MLKHNPLVALSLFALVVISTGCKDSVLESCPNPSGVFIASYRLLDGSCGSFVTNSIKVADDDRGTVTKVETRLSDIVTTELIFKGCTLAVNQSVSANGKRVSEMSGDLQVEDEAALSGMMTRTEYMDTGAIRCHSVYDIRYVRQDQLVGGAVEYTDSL